ncbi:MAG: hypothetical protein L3J91_03425, partial [Thermoplasmata archaeon]|nr:hypothetical protein [Thermoplasmata archaeon]
MAVRPGRDLFWTDVALRGAVGQDVDPLTSTLLPPDRVSVVFANELERDEPSARLADAAVGGVLRADESPEMLRRIAGFLRLPAHTQELLSRVPSGGPPPIIVLSNAHRMVALYPHDTVAP